MDCRQCQDVLDNLLAAEPTPAQRAELTQHTEACPDCARQHHLANQALAAITPTSLLPLSADFKERVMQALSDARVFQLEPLTIRVLHGRAWKRAWKLAAVVAAAAVLLVALMPFFRSGPGPGPGHNQGKNAGFSAFSLLSEAYAAEGNLFAGNQIVHLVNEIIVTPVADPELAKMRWFPLVSLEATGKPRFDQLALAVEPGKGYTVDDQAWYDPPTGRFARAMTVAGKPIFANSFDGSNFYTLEIPPAGTPRVVKQAVGKDFRPPKSPAEFLGLGTGLRSGLDRKDRTMVHDAGKTTLEDGTEAYVLKSAPPPEGSPKEMQDSYALFTIRTDNNLIEKIEMVINGQSMYVVRRGKSEPGPGPTMGWDLAGLAKQAAGGPALPGLGIVANVVVPNVSIEHMVKKADFATYIFSKDPSWAGDREITDILDLPSPPHRMFSVAYRAKDGRHVVLAQGYTFNQGLGELAKKMGKLVYTSPGGVKVWSGPRDQWLANILLQSARASIHDPPVKEPTGYLLETPAETFPVLAINGKLTEEELHALIDSLVPATDSGD